MKIEMYKIHIANGGRSKTKYYESKKTFERWYKDHKKFYGSAVSAYKLVNDEWELITKI